MHQELGVRLNFQCQPVPPGARRQSLALLQEDASLPISEISRRVHLSQFPCRRRIRKLEQSGAIERKAAIFDPAAIVFGISAFVEIKAANHSGDRRTRFRETSHSPK